MRCYVSASNRNVFSRFLNVSRDKSVDRMQVVWQRIPHDGTMNGETTVAVTRPCVWNDELAYCYRRRTTQRGLCVCVCVCVCVWHTDELCKTAEPMEMPFGGWLMRVQRAVY